MENGQIFAFLILCALLYFAYQIIRLINWHAVITLIQWVWGIAMLFVLIGALMLGGITGEEIIPVVGFLIGEGVLGLVKPAPKKLKE